MGPASRWRVGRQSKKELFRLTENGSASLSEPAFSRAPAYLRDKHFICLGKFIVLAIDQNIGVGARVIRAFLLTQPVERQVLLRSGRYPHICVFVFLHEKQGT